MKKISICVLGDGGWGTTLAILLSRKGFKVTLWSVFSDYARYLDAKRINKKFLPGIKIPAAIDITSDIDGAVKDKDLIVFAIPSEFARSVLKKLKRSVFKKSVIFVSVAKGIEIGSLKRISEIINEELGRVDLAVLSGPTIAHEIAVGKPAAAVIACRDKKLGKLLQDVFMTDRFRVYTCDDMVGVELGGSLKNVIAIACGISDGLGFGTNTKAALLARGLAEISRFGEKIGARHKTFSGISGLGDLVTTCISPYSRNRFIGEQVGKGRNLKEIKKRMQMVAEGVPTAKSAFLLSRRLKVDMPITHQVYSVLYENKSPLKAVRDLMSRSKKEE